jgi:hypothetical protein
MQWIFAVAEQRLPSSLSECQTRLHHTWGHVAIANSAQSRHAPIQCRDVLFRCSGILQPFQHNPGVILDSEECITQRCIFQLHLHLPCTCDHLASRTGVESYMTCQSSFELCSLS